MLRVFAVLAFAGLTAASAMAQAPVTEKTVAGYVMVDGINARNGNFSLTYPAFEDSALAYRRTYNSLSSNPGVFGRGWGSLLDTRLIELPDGRVAVRENGNGAIAVYGAPKAGETMEALERALMATESSNTPLSSRAPLGDMLPIDTTKALAAQVCDQAYLSRQPDGWVRRTCLQGTQVFDRKGRLVEYAEGTRAVTIKRRFGKIRSLSATGQKLNFHYGWRTLRVTGLNKDWYNYRFDASGYNIHSDSPKSGPLIYSYDAAGRLTDVLYMDTTHVQIAYDAAGRVNRKVDRTDNTVTLDYQTMQTLVTRQTKGQTEQVRYIFIDPPAGEALAEATTEQ